MDDVQVNVGRKWNHLSIGLRILGVDQDQIDIGRPAEQRLPIGNAADQVGRDQVAGGRPRFGLAPGEIDQLGARDDQAGRPPSNGSSGW